MTVKETRENVIGKGKPGPGRPKGLPNKTTALLKDAILTAAEQHGLDGEGTDGLVGYCRLLAKAQPKAFAQLLGKVIPTQLTETAEKPIVVELVSFCDLPADNNVSSRPARMIGCERSD